MVRLPAQWSSNSAKDTPVILYDADSVTYDSATTAFDAIDVTLNDSGRIAQQWDSTAKTPAAWQANSAFPSGEVYNPTGRTFDTIYPVYDAISGESPISDKELAVWSEA